MKPVSEMDYHPITEKLVNILRVKSQHNNPLFFRVVIAFYFSLIASMMRTQIATLDRGDIPVNLYALALSSSGTGKGVSTNLLEEQVINQFQANFLADTFPLLAEKSLPKLALKRAQTKACDPNEELERVQKEFEGLGTLLFTFDSGTSPAVKQMRHKLLMAKAGSMNLVIDEIGSNLLANVDVLNTFLELYDVGKVKQKLIKNTQDNVRNEEVKGRTPTNMLLFGTPSKLLNGGKTEEEMYSMLDTGFARRCVYAVGQASSETLDMTPEEIFNMTTDSSHTDYLEELSDRLGNLANIINADKKLVISKDVTLLLIEYKQQCERNAYRLPEHEEMKKAEISHRYFKALKLAGAYAFIDDSPELLEAHLYYAIKLCEESGEAFNRILTRDRNYVKLAKYIVGVGREVTEHDLTEDLPFYKGGVAQKSEMLQQARAYGYQNNIIIKQSFQDGINFLRGESLKETDLAKMRVAYSTDMTTGYKGEAVPFNQLHKMTQANGIHWVTHFLKDGYRNEENALPGFNLVVIDVDGGVALETAQLLLKDYQALYYTTKRHTPGEHRFRILLPINYELSLDAKDYKEFMAAIFDWLPFSVDDGTGQRCKKWLSHPGHFAYVEGKLLDALPFIPKTTKNEERKKHFNAQQSLDALERWVINNTGDGNRNNQLLKYAYVLVDCGHDYNGVRSRVMELNDKLPDKLTETELTGTIFQTVIKAIAKRAVA